MHPEKARKRGCVEALEVPRCREPRHGQGDALYGRAVAITLVIADNRRLVDRGLGCPRLVGELREREAVAVMLNNRDEEDRIMLAAAAIARLAAEMPIDLAISALMVVVTEIIRGSEDPAQLWAALEWGVATHRRLQHRIVNVSDRLQ